ncbi:MAG: ABC transporter substrate-binding protein [Actinomycetota bacterium]
MRLRRSIRIAVATLAVSVVAVGTGVGPASAQQIDPKVKNVKKVKTPKNCPDIQGVTDSEIKIGSIAPMTGPSSGSGFFPNIIKGAEVRFDVANADDEVGRKLTIVALDDKGDTAQNLSAAQNLVEQAKVFAVMPMSAVGAASAPYLNQKGIPAVGWQLGLDVYGKYPNFFGLQNGNASDLATNYNSRTADAIAKVGGKKIALIGGNTGNSAIFLEQVNDSIKRFHKKDGLTVVYKNSDVPPGNTQWGSYVDQIKSSGADFVYAPLVGIDLFGFLGALKQAGVTAQTMSPSGYSPRVLGVSAYENHIFGLEFKPLETTPAPEGMAAFKAAMAKYAPDAPIDQGSALGWLAGNAMIEGIKAAGEACPTWKGFINNLRLEKGYTADGWFEPVDFQAAFNRPIQCAYYVQQKGTQFTPLFDSKAVCGQDVRNNKLVTTATTTPPTTAAG